MQQPLKVKGIIVGNTDLPDRPLDRDRASGEDRRYRVDSAKEKCFDKRALCSLAFSVISLIGVFEMGWFNH